LADNAASRTRLDNEARSRVQQLDVRVRALATEVNSLSERVARAAQLAEANREHSRQLLRRLDELRLASLQQTDEQV
jgi:TolA-binding protein